MHPSKPYMLYLIVAVTVILSSMLIGVAGAFEKSDMGVLSGFTFGGVLFSLPWLFNAWRSRKQIVQSVDPAQGELLAKEEPKVKPYTPHLITGLILMIVPIILGVAMAIQDSMIEMILPGILFGSLFACPLIWRYQQSKYPSTNHGDDEVDTGWHGYTQVRSQPSFNSRFNDDCTSSPVFRSLPQNIYHNRHY